MVNVFFSYSHKDESLRDELETHCRLMQREGLISGWHDRRIGAGKDFAGAISEELEKADIILLLVSSNFVASDYCFDVEMRRAMERHNEGTARVIPVILHPCDWHTSPFGNLLAVPRDGKPISKYPNQHDAFLEVVKAVRDAAKEMQKSSKPLAAPRTPATTTAPSPQVRSSNLRVVKTFSDRDKDAFLEESFEYLTNFFEGSLTELGERNLEIETKFKRIDANHFATTIYKNGSIASQCKIWLSTRGPFSSSILYSHDVSNLDNSFNESMSVGENGHNLFLTTTGMASFGNNRDASLSQEGAAEYFWAIVIRPLQQRDR